MFYKVTIVNRDKEGSQTRGTVTNLALRLMMPDQEVKLVTPNQGNRSVKVTNLGTRVL